MKLPIGSMGTSIIVSAILSVACYSPISQAQTDLPLIDVGGYSTIDYMPTYTYDFFSGTNYAYADFFGSTGMTMYVPEIMPGTCTGCVSGFDLTSFITVSNPTNTLTPAELGADKLALPGLVYAGAKVAAPQEALSPEGLSGAVSFAVVKTKKAATDYVKKLQATAAPAAQITAAQTATNRVKSAATNLAAYAAQTLADAATAKANKAAVMEELRMMSLVLDTYVNDVSLNATNRNTNALNAITDKFLIDSSAHIPIKYSSSSGRTISVSYAVHYTFQSERTPSKLLYEIFTTREKGGSAAEIDAAKKELKNLLNEKINREGYATQSAAYRTIRSLAEQGKIQNLAIEGLSPKESPAVIADMKKNWSTDNYVLDQFGFSADEKDQYLMARYGAQLKYFFEGSGAALGLNVVGVDTEANGKDMTDHLKAISNYAESKSNINDLESKGQLTKADKNKLFDAADLQNRRNSVLTDAEISGFVAQMPAGVQSLADKFLRDSREVFIYRDKRNKTIAGNLKNLPGNTFFTVGINHYGLGLILKKLGWVQQ